MFWVIPLHQTQYPKSINYFTIYHLYPMICLILTINSFSFILLVEFFYSINHHNSFCRLPIILLLKIHQMIRLMILQMFILNMILLILAHPLFLDQVFVLFFEVLMFLIICFPGFIPKEQGLCVIFFLVAFLLFFRLN